jgi:Tfp pilus assembly protein PilF
MSEALAGPAVAQDTPVRISGSRLQINQDVARGYQDFLSGNVAAARAAYERALQSDPRNTDALNGLAAINLGDGRPDAAEAYYQRALEADPKDATAQAGLIGLRGNNDPLQAESRLKTLVALQPDAYAAQFALGNAYASQGRWHDAQQAYFRAYTGDPDNPDYQFNLAVSLDQLHQPQLALQYYQGALAAAAARPAAFDKAQVAFRVHELQP